MNRRSRGPLVASVCFLIAASSAVAQNDDCDNDCQAECDRRACAVACSGDALSTVDLCNADLGRLDGFEPAIYGPVPDEVNELCPIVRPPAPEGRKLCTPNLAVAAILSQLDIDGDGIPDNAPDTDGDGLPDNWELGGFEAPTADGDETDRVVFYPAPTAIVPGTPPTPIFTRLAVTTSAFDPDTDGDKLSDFIEVFGLMFIDENGNGLLDSSSALIGQEDGQTVDRREWNDLNTDGLPSPGEHPIDNAANEAAEARLGQLHDFDGFVFTDPNNRDTDGDGDADGVDKDPLINPKAFGNLGPIIVRFGAEENPDVDQDGLGNGMDMGNDLTSEDGPGVQDFEVIDNPDSIGDLLDFFRRDLLAEQPPVLPESESEDLLGADWDGNGLWRTTDVRTWHIVIGDSGVGSLSDPSTIPDENFFEIGGHELYVPQSLDQLKEIVNHDDYKVYAGGVPGIGDVTGGRSRVGMGWQDLLKPSGTTKFIPDGHIWAILYSWRMPGFDIDGDGFVGVPNIPATFSGDEERPTALLRRNPAGRFELVGNVPKLDTDRPFDDRIELRVGQTDSAVIRLDGIIEPPAGFAICGATSFATILLIVLGLATPRYVRRR